MRIIFRRLVHSLLIVVFFCALIGTYGCDTYKFVKTYEGPDLPASQVAKLFLDKGTLSRPDRNRPISFVVDGKPYTQELNQLTSCLFLLPGEHEVTIHPLPQMRNEPSGELGKIILYKEFPFPEQHVFRFTAEKGREYLVAEDYPDSRYWDYMIFWIEDKMSKKKITDDIRFDWKKGGLPPKASLVGTD